VGARFSAPFQTSPGAYTASYTMGTGSFSGVNRPDHGVDHPLHLAPRLKKEYSYASTSYGPSWPVLGWTLPLPLPFVTNMWCSCCMRLMRVIKQLVKNSCITRALVRQQLRIASVDECNRIILKCRQLKLPGNDAGSHMFRSEKL